MEITNSRVISLVLFVYCSISTEAFSKFPSSKECEENERRGNWTCIKNDDNTVNITFDCGIIGHEDLELELNSLEYPKKLKSIKIQNCKDLILDISCNPDFETHYHDHDTSTIEWSNLHIVNIKNLHLKNAEKRKYDFRGKRRVRRLTPFGYSRYPWDRDEAESDEEPEKSITGPLRSVIFENIANAKLERLEFPSQSQCSESNTQLEYLKFINVNISEEFKGISKNVKMLKEFLVDGVKFSPGGKYKRMKVDDEKAVVNIVNSNFIPVEEFFEGKVSKIVVMGNEFDVIATSGLRVEANEFVFSGNSVGRLKGSALNVKAADAQITTNIIQQVDGEAFEEVLAKYSDSKFRNGVYNFSNNEMHLLDTRALSVPFRYFGPGFNLVRVFNNSVNCSCRNFEWFDRFLSYRHSDNRWFNLWIKKDNQNKCLNVKNCLLQQAIYNYYEFCEEEYQCPQNVSIFDKPGNFILEVEETVKSSSNSFKEIAKSASKIFEILSGESKNFDHLESLFLINTVFLIILLVLVIVILCYFIFMKFFYVDCLSFRPRKLRSLDTQMNSQVSLT